MKSITVNDYDWEEKLVVDIKCPYCNEYQEIEGDDNFTNIKCECIFCGKHFTLKTKRYLDSVGI